MSENLIKRAAIVGVGETDVGRVLEKTARQLEVEAIKLALDDAGLTKKDIDGVLTFLRWDSGWETKAPILAERLGIEPVLPLTLAFGGTSSTSLFMYAGLLVAAGLAEFVLVSSSDTQLSNVGRQGTMEELVGGTADPQFELPYGVNNPALYAQYAHRHMYEFGTTSEQLASVAVTFRDHASRHPKAQIKESISIQDVLNSRMITSPFHLLDCGLISDGGWAIIMTSAERARDLKQKPVQLLGAAEAHFANWVSHLSDLTTTAATKCAEKALSMAGVQHEDIDVLFLSDQFTICPTVWISGL